MTTEALAAALLRVLEGCRLTAYRDTGGVLTIGFGHTAGVTDGMTITMEQAEQFLAEDAAPLFSLVADKPIVAAAAYVSFGYNCGAGALKRVLAGAAQIEDFNHSGGSVQLGLVSRRALEAALIEAGGG